MPIYATHQDCELSRIISPSFDLIPEHVRYIMYGILRGLNYLHSAGKIVGEAVMHTCNTLPALPALSLLKLPILALKPWTYIATRSVTSSVVDTTL